MAINPVGTDTGAAAGEYDADAVAAAIRQLLIAIGEDPDRDGLRETPERVARSYAEMFGGLRQDPEDVLTTVFDVGHEELVIVKDIQLYSTCEHHLLPFYGVAHVGYIPNASGQITGLSKLARLVDVFARRPQVQERLTTQIADAIVRILQPRGAIVVVEAEHTCMSVRGVRKAGSMTVTSAMRGTLLNAATRAEAMALIKARQLCRRCRYPGWTLECRWCGALSMSRLSPSPMGADSRRPTWPSGTDCPSSMRAPMLWMWEGNPRAREPLVCRSRPR